MAIKTLGTLDGKVDGWALVSDVSQVSGSRRIEYRGSLANLSVALNYIKTTITIVYDDIEVSEDTDSGTASIVLTKSAVTSSKPPAGQTKNPTVSIQGAMLSPQLHQHPTFKGGEESAPLTLSAITKTNYCLKQYGQVVTGDLHGEAENAFTYARWRSYGIDTYLASSYTMTITYYLESTSDVKGFIKKAGKVFAFKTVINKLTEDLQPKDIDVPAWLAQAPSINISSDGVTLSQAFVGAQAFPSFYESEDEKLVYDAPELPDVYWRDSKLNQQSSGEE